MTFAPSLTRQGRAYVTGVVALGFLVIGESLLRLYRAPVGSEWALLAILTLISGSASVELPRANVSISISEAFVFTAVLLYGPAAGTLTVALDGLVLSLWIARRRPEIDRALFNIAAPALSAWCSAHLFFKVSGIAPLAEQAATVNQILPALVLFAATYFGLNSGLIATVIAFQRRENPFRVWRNGFIWLSLNYFCGASVAMLLVGYNRSIDLRFVGLVVPLLLVLYFTFKISMERVEDANRHLEQLNTLYLSTIETLAMAIDAKDQITHGHIRRVQVYAVGLAKRLGVTDERLIKAIEAAALLHDMGKLAVPEYILNKPGKLTATEFEKMKLHASVGADILSAIDFPYPVVPIVRHHHENWNGTGYPTGLRGTDIPIGARVLSVVDCFDALTSDRPYRPRLSDEEATKILMERRGSMYDPLVVDVFVRVHAEISRDLNQSSVPGQVLQDVASASATQRVSTETGACRLDEIAASSDETRALYELARSLAGLTTISEVGDAVAKHLRRLIPFSLYVVYAYDSVADELEAKHGAGDAAPLVKGLKIPTGQRVSGWAAANRQVIVNSDPTLDLGEIARVVYPRLRNCVSTPLVADSQLIGVITVYSSATESYTEEHRRILDAVTAQAAQSFRRAIDGEPVRSDPPVDLPHISQLDQSIASLCAEASNPVFSLMFVAVRNFDRMPVIQDTVFGEQIYQHVAQQFRRLLRPHDVLFRAGPNQIVALLRSADHTVAEALAAKADHHMQECPLILPNGASVSVEIGITNVHAPTDGRSVVDLTRAAQMKRASVGWEGTTLH
jgi:putative nucleotidyltransferase with HDIG domain